MKIYVVVLWALLLVSIGGCTNDPDTLICAHGTVIGQGCLTESYAIRLERKNKAYGINENLTYDNVVETLNLPDEYKVNGTKVYFTFKKPSEETGKYLTYCTPAPQITILDISNHNCPVPVKESK